MVAMHASGMRLYIFDSRKTRTTPITSDRQFLNSTSTSTINLSFKRVTLVQEHDIYQCELTTVELTNAGITGIGQLYEHQYNLQAHEKLDLLNHVFTHEL